MYLELTDISKKIGADEVLSGITLSMEKGKVYGLQGKNGCGKSMLMRVICGLVLPTVGEVKIDGKILGKPADKEEAREMIYKLQDKYEGRYKYHEIQNEKNNSTYGSSSIGSIYIWKGISNGSRKYRSNGGSGRRSGNGG